MTEQNMDGQTLSFRAAKSMQSTSLVAYQSRGHCLVISTLERGLEVLNQLQANGKTLFIHDDAQHSVEKNATEDGVKVITAKALALHGYLGSFDCVIGDPESPGSLAKMAGVSLLGGFDTVLDLSEKPLLKHEVLPFGYYAPGDDADALAGAMAEIAELEGDFEKPKYFDYDASICAHSRSGITACTNCIDVCGTGAITSNGDGVSVEPYLCQGCGSCASSCPSGAMRYAYPAPADAMAQLAELLSERRRRGQHKTVVFFHDTEQGAERLQSFSDNLSDAILPVSVEEVASIGMDGWFTALAYGASAVVIDAPDVQSAMFGGLNTQLGIANQILAGIGLHNRLQMMAQASAESLNPVAETDWLEIPVAGFKTFNDKRQTTRMALDHLFQHATGDKTDAIDLPEEAAFGRVQVDKNACTLCLACVTVCPARALQDGETLPQLKFIESNCLQCGMCESACPERAISLESRYLYDSETALKPMILNEEKPFNCIVCNVAFATEGIIVRMQAKLSDHWMFKDDKAVRRLKMCEDCRVKDIFENESGIDVHKS